MAKRKVFYCSIHGGPIYGRGWGGHKSHGTCPNGQRMTEREYLKAGGAATGMTAPRKLDRRLPRFSEPAPVEGDTGGLLKGAASLRDKVNAEIIRLEGRLDHLRDMRTAIEKILKIRV